MLGVSNKFEVNKSSATEVMSRYVLLLRTFVLIPLRPQTMALLNGMRGTRTIPSVNNNAKPNGPILDSLA